jgi:hypothetical protein
MTTQQMFVCVNDLIEDQQSAGASEARWYQAIRDASDFLQKEIGTFIPITATRKMNGRGNLQIFTDPLLSITSIVNDGTTLSPSDYILQPYKRHWESGPYSSILRAPDASNLSAWDDEDNGVVLNATWGLYDRSGATGATVASDQSDSASTLAVSNGGKVSPGMVLLIGSEQQLVTGWGSPTSTVSQLSAAMTASDQTLSVDNGSLFSIGEIIRCEFEQMKVRDIRTNQLAVTRGWNGSGQTTHADNSAVDVYRSVNVERAVNGTTAAAHATNAAISRYFAPDDVQFLTRQIATLMLNKAKSGYQGKTGNTDTGTVYYYDSFPRFEIERVAANYRIYRVG